MITLSLQICYSSHHHLQHNCQYNEDDLEINTEPLDEIIKLDDEFKPIRFKLDYSSMKKTPHEHLIKDLLQQAMKFLETVYSIQRAPKIHEIIGKHKCGGFKIPKEHQEHGIVGSDLVVYVGVESSEDHWLAKSGPCILNHHSHRPVAARVIINSRYLDLVKLDDTTKFRWLGTITHEMTHILGFTKNQFKRLNLYVEHKGKPYIKSPKLVELGRKYFNCNNLDMLPLEDDGGKGTSGSHWEKLAFGDEIMTGTAVQSFVYSKFTMLAMEATGVYKVDLNKASTYVWGADGGCAVSKGSCHSSVICDENTQKFSCSVDTFQLSYCKPNSLLYECGLKKEYRDCRWEGKRCFEGTNKPKCLKSQCENGQIRIEYKDKTYVCQKDNEMLKLRGIQIKCPIIAEFCAIDTECGGRGRHNGDKCECFIGFTGTHCQKLVF